MQVGLGGGGERDVFLLARTTYPHPLPCIPTHIHILSRPLLRFSLPPSLPPPSSLPLSSATSLPPPSYSFCQFSDAFLLRCEYFPIFLAPVFPHTTPMDTPQCRRISVLLYILCSRLPAVTARNRNVNHLRCSRRLSLAVDVSMSIRVSGGSQMSRWPNC